MTQRPLVLAALFVALSASWSRPAQGSMQGPGVPTAANAQPEAVPPRPDEACRGRVGVAEIETVEAKDGLILASGTWAASPGTDRLALEVRIDSDRQVLALYQGTSGRWSTRFPFDLCGKHQMRVYPFASVPGERETLLCFEGAPSAAHRFVIDCTPTAALGACSFDCPKGSAAKGGKGTPPADAACKATCAGTAQGGMGALTGFASLNGTDVRVVERSAGGSWPLSFSCKPGDKIAFWVRDRSGTGATAKAAETVCAPR